MLKERTFLFVCAGIFGSFGLIALLLPVQIAGTVGIELTGGAARVDFRATYGGWPIGTGVFLLLSALRPGWQIQGLYAVFLSTAGFALARFGAMTVDGPGSAFIVLILIVELLVTGIAGWLILASRPKKAAPPEKE